tara:strand:- start:126 stop:401 length:276 start_codon:yes stop_codon:yes gene_type:complete
MRCRDSAIVAAESASDAVSELIRYAREGNHAGKWPFSEGDPVCALADALARAAAIEGAAYSADPSTAPDAQHYDALIRACRDFLECHSDAR